MDPLELLASLEGLREKIPAFLRQDFEDLIAGIRNTYEMSVKYVTPPEPVHDGRRNLAAHHNTLDGLCTQLESSLQAFQLVYIGAGSDAYHTRAAASLQDLKTIREHLAQAAVLHTTMASNFDTATEAKLALVALLVTLAITLGVLIASAGTTAPVTVPAAAVEVAGGAVSIGLMTEAEAAAAAAIMGLIWAALPEALLAGLAGFAAMEVLGHIALHPPAAHTSTAASSPAGIQVLQLNLPKEPDLTPEQQAAVEDMVRELANQLGVNPISLKKWLKLIAQALGTNATAAQIKGTLRCLASKGYLDPSVSSAWNSVADHLTPRDIQGAWGDNNGYDTNANHQGEVGDSQKSLENFIDDINTKLADHSLSGAKRAYYNTLKASAQKTFDYVKRLINLSKKQGPSTDSWEEPKGRVPFPQAILEGSGCLSS